MLSKIQDNAVINGAAGHICTRTARRERQITHVFLVFVRQLDQFFHVLCVFGVND